MRNCTEDNFADYRFAHQRDGEAMSSKRYLKEVVTCDNHVMFACEGFSRVLVSSCWVKMVIFLK